ncbi:MAG: fimbrillin family protein, partial [Acinetobacter sp.]
AAQVTAGIDGTITRAVDALWGNNDAIGISCSSTSTNYTNMKYVTSEGNGTFTHDGGAASGIFFQGTDDVTFSAYYPFSGTAGSLPETSGSITGNTSNQASNQTSIDYMFATGAKTTYASPTVSFTNTAIFKHKMTRLILILKTDATAGFTATDVQNGTYTLGGLKHDGTFKVTDGTAEVTNTSTAVPNWSVSTNCPFADASNQRTYTMILYPQSVTGALPFTATISSKDYKNTADIKFDSNILLAGTSYTFIITIKKTGLAVSSCTIEGWTGGTGGSGNAEM